MTSSADKLLHQAMNILSDIGEAKNRNVFDHTQNLIDMIRYALSSSKQQLGVWEAMELNSANSALGAGFLKLAITFACRAIEVNSLSEAEYLFGFEAVRHHHDRPEHPAAGEQETQASFRLHDARDLLWLQNTTAISLLQDQLLQAKGLTFQQKLAAESLMLVQENAAATLIQEDGVVAKGLIVAQKAQSSQPASSIFAEAGVDAGAGVKEDKEVALKLKESQRLRAFALQLDQKKAAAELVNNEAAGSGRLKSAQKKEAVVLKETNLLKALLKKKEQAEDGSTTA